MSIALGLMAFCLVGLLGLLPQGLKQERRSSDQLQILEVLTAVASDFRVQAAGTSSQPSRYGLKLPEGTGSTVYSDSFLVDEQGETTNSPDKAAFKVWREVKPPASAFDTYQMYVCVSRAAGTDRIDEVKGLAGKDFAEAIIAPDTL